MIDYAYWEADFTVSDGKAWWLNIGWDKQPDGTMDEESIGWRMNSEEEDECTRQFRIVKGLKE